MDDSTAVLVIDDEPSMLQLLRALLEADGFAVYEAMTGPIGLGLIPAVSPRAVVLDVMMPGMDGIEVCARIAAEHPDLPVVILTGRDDGDLERRCLAAGAARFLTKPLLPGQLTDTLSSLLVGLPPLVQ
ncbi:MAG TPA: response regulator [Acidimicrobiales bacterium]|nr:response regulator [Acidimicrobiales bacterium]